MADLISQLSSLSNLTFNPRSDDDQDDKGEDVSQDAPPARSKSQLRVSHALRSFLVQQGILSESGAGLAPGPQTPHSGAALASLMDRDHVRVPPAVLDRSHPLPEYYVSSSHNTYLVAHQLYGESSAAAYVTAIRTGARCVEIDAWDNAEDEGEPKVTHGYTLVSHVSFRSVCERIRYAYDREDERGEGNNPILISLENHCGESGQMRLVQIMKEVFGRRLLTAPVSSRHPEEHVTLEQLRGKVAVIVEFHLPEEADDDDDNNNFSNRERSLEEEIQRRARRSFHKYVNGAGKEGGDNPAPSAVIIPELAALGVYAQSVKPRDTSWYTHGNPLNGPHHHLINLSETALAAHLPANSVPIAQHNARSLMRVFPRGTRIASSNLPAVPCWGVGAQICALNWQTYNTSHQLNRALFAGSSQGYTLKPAALRRGGSGDLRSGRWKRLILHVAGATDIPLPEGRAVDDSIRPYVTCTLYSPLLTDGEGLGYKEGEGNVGKGIKRKTGYYRQHRFGFLRSGENPGVTEPVWDELLEWEYEDNELVFLRILIKSDDSWAPNPRLAVAAVRVMYLVGGWSFVRMMDLGGRPTDCTLLVRFEVQELN